MRDTVSAAMHVPDGPDREGRRRLEDLEKWGRREEHENRQSAEERAHVWKKEQAKEQEEEEVVVRTLYRSTHAEGSPFFQDNSS